MSRILTVLRSVERQFINSIFGRRFPPSEPLYALASESPAVEYPAKKFELKDIIGDGFLYAVPKFRRTIEKRLKRKFGVPGYNWKLIVPKTHLRVCITCGHHHENGVLCENCYNRVKAETTEMQEEIKKGVGLNPIEEDVIVLYEGEKLDEPEEFWKGKRVVEMKKPRPSWFSKNLLQKSTQQPATTTSVKPTELA